MTFDRDIAVLALFGAMLVLELAGRLTMVIVPARFSVWRARRWWRRVRIVQVVLLVLLIALLYDIYQYPATPAGRIEQWMHRAEVLERNGWHNAGDWQSKGP